MHKVNEALLYTFERQASRKNLSGKEIKDKQTVLARSGKGVTSACPAILSFPESTIMLDFKGESFNNIICNTTKKKRKTSVQRKKKQNEKIKVPVDVQKFLDHIKLADSPEYPAFRYDLFFNEKSNTWELEMLIKSDYIE